MRIGFFGSPHISAQLLEALLDGAEHEIVGVVSNADRARGRSQKMVPTEVSQLALKHNLPLLRPENLKEQSILQSLRAWQADIFVVFAYGKLMPVAVFDLPPAGSINLHGSLLPELRGASPIQSAILRGLDNTGWTVQKVVEGLDAGNLLLQSKIAIDPEETSGELFERMLPMGIELILACLHDFNRHVHAATIQDKNKVTHCHKLKMEMSWLDWELSAAEVHNQVRAFNPWPMARAMLAETEIQIMRTRRPEQTVLSDWSNLPAGSFGAGPHKGQLLVKCADAVLEILELKPHGRKQLTGKDFLNGYRRQAPVILGKSRG